MDVDTLPIIAHLVPHTGLWEAHHFGGFPSEGRERQQTSNVYIHPSFSLITLTFRSTASSSDRQYMLSHPPACGPAYTLHILWHHSLLWTREAIWVHISKITRYTSCTWVYSTENTTAVVFQETTYNMHVHTFQHTHVHTMCACAELKCWTYIYYVAYTFEIARFETAHVLEASMAGYWAPHLGAMYRLLEGGVGRHGVQEELVELQSGHELATCLRLNTCHVFWTHLTTDSNTENISPSVFCHVHVWYIQPCSLDTLSCIYFIFLSLRDCYMYICMLTWVFF